MNVDILTKIGGEHVKSLHSFFAVILNILGLHAKVKLLIFVKKLPSLPLANLAKIQFIGFTLNFFILTEEKSTYDVLKSPLSCSSWLMPKPHFKLFFGFTLCMALQSIMVLNLQTSKQMIHC